jgi:multidrug efflux system outer membrane protein
MKKFRQKNIRKRIMTIMNRLLITFNYKKMKTYSNINRFKSLLIASLLLLAGCAVPKSAPQIDDITVTAFRNDSIKSQDKSTADLPWREFFANEELARLIDKALEKNNDLQIAVKDIEIADQLYRKARQGYLPEAGLSVSSSNSIPSENSLNGLTASQFLGTKDLNNYTASLGISWEADIWGKVKNQKKETLAQYLQTQEAKKGIQTMLITSIANGYYTLLMLDKQLVIAKENLVLNNRTLEIVKLQYQSAQVSSLAVQQQEDQKLATEQLIPKLEKEINIQENALSILIGVSPEAIIRSTSLDNVQIKDYFSTGIPSEMLSRRPDIKSSELELQAASARIGLAKANLYPSLIIGASGGVNSLKTSDWFNIPGSLFGIVAGTVAQPILNGRKLRTQFNISKIEREQSVLRFRQSVLVAYGEVSDALVRVDKLEKEQSIAGSRVRKFGVATANAELLFKSGMANYLEVITAQGKALSAELELASIKREHITASIDLYRSLGGGWN